MFTNEYLSDALWQYMKKFIPSSYLKRKRKHSLYNLFSGLFYLTRSGSSWRLLPSSYGVPWSSLYDYFSKWQQTGWYKKLLDKLVRRERIAQGRNPRPSLGCIDSQSVQSVYGGEAIGVDGYKLKKGRKRHILVDTQGNLLELEISPANQADVNQLAYLSYLAQFRGRPFFKILADAGYRSGALATEIFSQTGVQVEIVNSPRREKKDDKAFVPQPKRWVVERTFAWLNQNRRLKVDYEKTRKSAKAFVYLAMILNLINKGAKRNKK
ncbi:IS5 family transposase [Bernardetia sp. OM2101]|uniref:IS5 family transposase n=1 Tax=Bernardetia sp. OM2101 TaxID=3344876 RepID=UPI0035CEF462